MKYRLNKAEKRPVTIYNVAKTRVMGGKSIVTTSNYVKLIPEEEYETDDAAMYKWLAEYVRTVRHNPELERELKANGVPYEIEACRSCGGRIKKIKYHQVEVYDE